MTALSFSERLAAVREQLSRRNVDGLVVLRGDEFLGEYVAPYAERLAWLTGFTGSAGMALVLPDRAAVFSDGRYTVQLDEQVDGALWERLHITQIPPKQWLTHHAQGLRIGYDPRLISEAGLTALEGRGFEFVALENNPLDAAWPDQPARPRTPVIFQSPDLSGETSDSKRARLATELRANGENAALVTDPTSVAWLLNIRASDVPYTPVVLAFAILHDNDRAELFVERDRLTAETLASFGDEVTIRAVTELDARLNALSGKTVRVDAQGTALWFIQTLEKADATISRGGDLCVLPKACKNATEQQGARDVHRIDSTALCRFLHFVTTQGVGLRETELAERMDGFRAQSPDYRGESFAAISAAGPNAALPHYRALPGRDRVLTADSIYLIDSGGQYGAGTTDVTRTLWTGPDVAPSAIREAYTRVLKGNIALNQARFPVGTTGHRLDALARQFLWQAGMDYDHGTGHGIGSYLSVHEGPQNISAIARPVALQSGMIVSDEPGYYAVGHYGIRLENLLLVKPASVGTPGRYLEFEVLGFAPFDRNLIDVSLLDDDERSWLDRYHATTLAKIGPLVDLPTRTWLAEVCAPLA